MKKSVLPLLLVTSLLTFAQAPASNAQSTQQDQRPQGEGRRGGQGFGRGVGGEIKAINGDTITLTTRDGGTATVKTSSDTRFMRDGQDVKLSDFKVGDRVMVRGESTGTDTWKAEMVGTPRMMGGPGGGPGRPGGMDMERLREGLGKEFVAGEVKSIEGTKLTVLGPDGKNYVAQVDENTSFRKGRESITFPDIKVGDRVMGRGKVNSEGVFVAENVNVGGGGFGMGGARPQQTRPPAAPKQ